MTRSLASRVVRAGILTSLVDGTFSGVLSAFFYGSTATRLFQGVAATVIGPRAVDGGLHTALLGVLMHCAVAFGWSALFGLVVAPLRPVDRTLASPAGTAKVAAVYGPLVWVVMSFVVIPLLTKRPPAVTFRWWVQFVGHVPFVGLPIVGSIGRVTGQGRQG